jgi:hypothetical protein
MLLADTAACLGAEVVLWKGNWEEKAEKVCGVELATENKSYFFLSEKGGKTGRIC